MAGPLFNLCVGCMLSVAFGITYVRAQGGRIQFSGAVVAPTCASVDISSLTLASNQPGQNIVTSQLVCRSRGGARSYAQTVAALDDTAASTDRVLAYFTGYTHVAANHAPGPLLVTRTYQ